MAGYDQYRSAKALINGAGSQGVGPNKGVFIAFVGDTAGGPQNIGCAGITFGTFAGQTFGVPGLSGGYGNLPYVLPIQIRSYESHNTDNQIYLLG
tara:strand:- start:2624 stop:2908 length:285 start_codon:yes stop_codon:yes gene_type:complete